MPNRSELVPPQVDAPTPDRLLDYAGRSVVVTGAAGGVGAGIARRFAAAGAHVVCHYHVGADRAEKLKQAIMADGGTAITYGADLTTEAGAQGVMAATTKTFGRLDVVVNNAGVQPLAPLVDMSPSDFDHVVAGNLRTTFLCTRAAAQEMIAAGSGGSIINVASIEASQPKELHSHYNAAKAAVVMHTRAAALELGRHSIRVNVVSPGLIWRDGLDKQWPQGVDRWHAAAPLGRIGTPEDVGDACLFLGSPAARWISGAELLVDGGVSARPTW